MEVDLTQKMHPSSFIQAVTLLPLSWFRVTLSSFVHSRILAKHEFICKWNSFFNLHVCAKKGVELQLYSCIIGWTLEIFMLHLFMGWPTYESIHALLEPWVHKRHPILCTCNGCNYTLVKLLGKKWCMSSKTECTAIVLFLTSWRTVAQYLGNTQGRREDWRGPGQIQNVGPIHKNCVRGVWGRAPRKFWEFTCSEVCSAWGLLKLLFVHAYNTYLHVAVFV